VYNQKTLKDNICKVKHCHGDVVQIDELFTPVIAELNKKGYKTRACCSAHYDNNSSNAYSSYIYFEDDIVLPNLPKGYMYDQDLYPWVDFKDNKRNIIRIAFNNNKDTDLNELSKNIINNALSVLEWAERLEEIK